MKSGHFSSICYPDFIKYPIGPIISRNESSQRPYCDGFIIFWSMNFTQNMPCRGLNCGTQGVEKSEKVLDGLTL